MTFDPPFGKSDIFISFDLFPMTWCSGGWSLRWQHSLPCGMVQHAAPSLSCSLPLCMGQSHEIAANTHNTIVHVTGSSHPSRTRWPLQSQEIFTDFQSTFFFNNAFMSFNVTKLIIAWISVLTLFKEHYPWVQKEVDVIISISYEGKLELKRSQGVPGWLRW